MMLPASVLLCDPQDLDITSRAWKCIAVFLTVFVSAALPQQTNPILVENLNSVVHYEGDNAVLFCSVMDLGKHTVTWRKLPISAPLTIGDRTFVQDSRLHAEHVPNSSQWNLVIEDVKRKDEGEYECQVSLSKSKLRHRVRLEVRERPENHLPRIQISGQNVIRAGSTLVLMCNASLLDVAMERIGWVKDHQKFYLNDSRRYSIYTAVTLTGQSSGIISSTLQIKSARTDDSGVYLCQSTERAQMAGVKVDVQGGSNSKRAGARFSDKETCHCPESASYDMARNPSGAVYFKTSWFLWVVLAFYIASHHFCQGAKFIRDIT